MIPERRKQVKRGMSENGLISHRCVSASARALQLRLQQFIGADAQLSRDPLELGDVLLQQVLKKLATPRHHRRQTA